MNLEVPYYMKTRFIMEKKILSYNLSIHQKYEYKNIIPIELYLEVLRSIAINIKYYSYRIIFRGAEKYSYKYNSIGIIFRGAEKYSYKYKI